MQILKADTTVKVVIGPVVDATDGYSPETTLSLSTADAAEILKHDAGTVTDISGNTFAAITGADGYYNLTITAAQLDTEGMLSVCIADLSLCRPVKADFMVVNANVYDSLYAASATDYLQVDAVQVSSDTTAADNLELQFDGTGVSGDTFPASQAQLGNLATGSAAISVPAESQVLTTGTEVNSYTSTVDRDGIYHEISDSAGALEIYYQFDVTGNGVAVDVQMWGRLTGPNDTIGVYAYDWVGATWSQIGSMVGTSGGDGAASFNLLSKHTGTGANLGKVRVRGYAASGLTTATLYIDQAYVTYAVVAQSVGYAQGSIWIDTNNGQAGTVIYVNGVADNAVDNLADAITLNNTLQLDRFQLSPASSITFAESHTNEIWQGPSATMALGGQDISGSTFLNFQDLSGTATTPSLEAHFVDCEIDALTIGQAHFKHCAFEGTLTLTAAANYTIYACYSQVPGASAPVIDMGAAVGATTLSIRHWSGGLTINNLAAGDVLTLEGTFGTITLNGADATVEIRGIAKAVTNNLTGSPTVNDNALKETEIEAIIALLDDPRGEPAQGALPVNPDSMTKIDYLYKFLRNRITSTSSQISVYDDAGTTVDHKSLHSDDTTTYDRGEFISGP